MCIPYYPLYVAHVLPLLSLPPSFRLLPSSTLCSDLPVLTRYFPAEAVKEMTGPAKFLDIILYSRNEIHQENVVRYLSCFPPSLHSSVVLLSI
jgi:hypothetical protein